MNKEHLEQKRNKALIDLYGDDIAKELFTIKVDDNCEKYREKMLHIFYALNVRCEIGRSGVNLYYDSVDDDSNDGATSTAIQFSVDQHFVRLHKSVLDFVLGPDYDIANVNLSNVLCMVFKQALGWDVKTIEVLDAYGVAPPNWKV